MDLTRLAANELAGAELNFPRDRLLLSRRLLQPDCPPLPAPVEYEEIRMTGSAGVLVVSGLRTLSPPPVQTTPSVLLVTLEDPQNGRTRNYPVLALAGDSPRQPHFVLLALEPIRKPGSKLWLLALPLAWIGDAITFPVQLLMWIDYSDAH